NGPNASPTAALTAPANGASFTAPATITLTATASDTDGWITTVEFLRNGTVLGVTNIPPYSMTWSNVGAGSYTLSVRATDDRSAVTTSAAVTITVGAPNNPPTVSLTSPSTGSSYFAPANIMLSAAAADSDGTVARVDFYQGTTLIGTATSAPYTYTWTAVTPGNYALTARATDNRGAAATSTTVNIAVLGPNLAIVSPANNTTIDGDFITVTGTMQ